MEISPQDRFFGDYQHTVDGKNRITIPSLWRGEDLNSLFAVKFRKLSIIKLMPKVELMRQGSRFLNNPKYSPARAKRLRRKLYGSSPECPLDKEGRIILPSAMMESLALPREVVLVGVGESIEVWDRKKWSSEKDDLEDELEETSEEEGM